jgi:hypothetical protein
MMPSQRPVVRGSSYSWWLTLALTAFFVLPTDQVPLKLAILLPIVSCCPATDARRTVNPVFLYFGIALIVFGVFINIYDVSKNDKVWKMVNLYVVDFVIYLFICVKFAKNKNYAAIFADSVLCAFTAINAIHAALIILSMSGSSVALTYAKDILAWNFGVSPEYGFWAYTSNLLVAQMFLLPCAVALFLLDPCKWSMPRIWIFVAGVLVNLASLRLALILVFLLTSGALILNAHQRRAPNSSGHVLLTIQICVSVVIVVAFGAAIEGVYRLKLGDKVDGSDLRYQQAILWLEYWKEAPILGQGVSSMTVLKDEPDGMKSVVIQGRLSNEFGYELVPLKALAEIGVVGVGVYLSFIAFVFNTLGKYIHAFRRDRKYAKQYVIAVAARVGMVTYLFATCTNGYLTSFSGMSPVFLPFALAWHFANADSGRRSGAPSYGRTIGVGQSGMRLAGCRAENSRIEMGVQQGGKVSLAEAGQSRFRRR